MESQPEKRVVHESLTNRRPGQKSRRLVSFLRAERPRPPVAYFPPLHDVTLVVWMFSVVIGTRALDFGTRKSVEKRGETGTDVWDLLCLVESVERGKCWQSSGVWSLYNNIEVAALSEVGPLLQH